MQNADGVLLEEAQGHGYVLGLQHDFCGFVVPLVVGSLAGFGLVAAQLAAVGSAMAVTSSGLDFASGGVSVV
jgi:hypothetical protein